MASIGKSKGSKAAVWVILALLIIGLMGFGTANFGGGTRDLGTVGDTPVPIDRYARELNQELRTLSQRTGQNFTFAEAQSLGIDRIVLGRVVEQVAIEDEAARIGVSVGDENLREQIVQIPAFQGVDGNFDRQSYSFALENSGLTAAGFESTLRSEVARTILQGAVIAGTPTPDSYVDALMTYIAETREATFAVLQPSALEEPVAVPTESDLQAYYDENPTEFTSPETRVVTYAALTPDMVADEVEVPEDELRALYEDRSEQYDIPERRLVERLVFGSTEDAAAAKDRIDAGETDFDTVVEDRGLSLDDVDMGDVARGDLSGAAADAVFGLEEPGVVGPVDTSLGPALFRMNAILSARQTSFEDAREELTEELAAEEAQRLVDAQIDVVDDELAGGASLEELANTTPLELNQIELTPGSTEGIAADAAFREAVNAAAIGDFPEVLNLDEGGIFALRLDEVREPTLQPFDEVRNQVAEAWTQQATTDALADLAETYAARLNDGEAFGALGLSSRSQAGITRQGSLMGAPQGTVEAIFALNEGEADVVTGGGAVAVVLLDAIDSPDPEASETASLRGQIAEQSAQSLGADMLAAFTQAVENRAGIQLDQNILNQVNANFR